MMLFVPESPRYLVGKGKHEEAFQALFRFRGATVREQVDPELTAVIYRNLITLSQNEEYSSI
jgi:hypothetical protein